MTNQWPETTSSYSLDFNYWSEVMVDWYYDAPYEVPFHFYKKQKLLVIDFSFLRQICNIDPTDSVPVESLGQMALEAARMRFPETKTVRISFGETWPVKRRTW